MNEKKDRVTITVKDSQKNSETLGEEKPGQKDPNAEEKPLEKMTKPELLEKVKELQEDSKKNYDLYLRSQAESEN